jgi:hypothetical protein
MSRNLRLVIWSTGIFIVVLIFSPFWRYVVDDYFHLEGIYRTLASALGAGVVCGIYALIARPLLR